MSPPPARWKAIGVRWTGHAPTNELAAVCGLLKAKDVEDARVAMRNFAVGAQNWVFADDAGNIFHTARGNVWDSRSDHFRDEADRWRKNENRPVPFATNDVIDSAKERIVYTSP